MNTLQAKLMPRPAPRRAIVFNAVDAAAMALAGVCLLNLNDVVFMMFDVQQSVSLVMLFCSVLLIVKHGRLAVSRSFGLIVATYLTYVALGSMFGDTLNEAFSGVSSEFKYQLAYLPSILVIWGLTGYVVSRAGRPVLAYFHAFARNSLIVAAASVWATPFLVTLYVNVPPDAGVRLGGIFGNANEAAHVSLLAYVMCLAYPFALVPLQYAALVITGGAVVLTFSKAGMGVLVVITAAVVARRLLGAALLVAPFIAALLLLFLQDSGAALDALIEQPYFEMSDQQKSRLRQVQQMLVGDINDDVSTGRTLIWAITVERAMGTFPVGGGLGSFHNIVGGIFENGVWQGAHNSFLMLWGEAGIVPILLLLASLISMATAIRRLPAGGNGFYLLLLLGVLVADMMSSHNSLSRRYHSVALALVLGVLASDEMRRRHERRLSRH